MVSGEWFVMSTDATEYYNNMAIVANIIVSNIRIAKLVIHAAK